MGLLGINIGPNKDTKDRLKDYLTNFRTFHDIADYITINISSPNTENLRNFHDETKFDEMRFVRQMHIWKMFDNSFSMSVTLPEVHTRQET